jgi:amino acid adenylation domain-containing protein
VSAQEYVSAQASPVSFAQQRMWFTERMAPGNPAQHLRFAAWVDGPLDVDRLADAVNTVVERHEVLRTCFAVFGGELQQVVLSEVRLPVPVVDLSGAADPDTAVRDWAVEEFRRPFALDTAPPLRLAVLRTDEHRHALLMTVHHIAADAWSRRVLLHELASAYSAAAQPPRSRIQYADYAAWQRDQFDRGGFDADLTYWQHQLADLSTLDLPTDCPRPPTPSYRGATSRLIIDAEFRAQLAALAADQRASLFMVLLAGFSVVLSRFSGQSDVVVGTPVANRERRETHELVGFFVNMLVVRLRLHGAPSLRELIDRTAEVCKQAYDHQEAPFDRVVDRLAPDREPSRHPLFQVVFQLVDEPAGVVDLPGLHTEPLALDDPTAPFDLVCTVTPTPAGALACELQYATDLWQQSSADRMCDAWLAVLSAVVTDPDSRAVDVDLLSARDRALLAAVNRTGRQLSEPATVDRLFRARAERSAGDIAVVDRDCRLTYGELAERADRLAAALTDAGVGIDSPVGLLMYRSAELVTAMLGVVLAGAAYVVLDPTYPPERLQLMISELGVTAVVVRRDPPAWLTTATPTVLSMTDVPADSAGTRMATPRGEPDSLVSVMFTSGSTGRPKAVGVSHRAVVRLVTRTDYIDIGPDDVMMHVGDPSFDITTLEVWGALAGGARLVVLAGDEPLGADRVVAAVRAHRPTILSLTGMLFNQVTDIDPAVFAGLHHLFVVGEVMDPRRTRRVLRHGAPARLHNGYGPTENTTFSTCYLANQLPDDAPSVPIGTPITNTTVHVLDERLRPVPVGVPGELYVGGLGLARGYLGQPALTAQRFVPDPFAAVPGQRLYRTGDLVRWQTDGALRFLGRADRQVKLRGYRVEPGEIESALCGCAWVRECAVRLMRVDTDTRLIAYVVPRPGHHLLGAALRAELTRMLPPFLIPQHFVVLDELPTTPSGKLDTDALPGPEASLPVSAATRVAPRTPSEQQLWEIWSDLLRVTELGVRDNFFTVGGHSLLATTLVTAIAQHFRVAVALRRVFELPTIAEQAAEIDRLADQVVPDELDGLVAELTRLDSKEIS